MGSTKDTEKEEKYVYKITEEDLNIFFNRDDPDFDRKFKKVLLKHLENAEVRCQDVKDKKARREWQKQLDVVRRILQFENWVIEIPVEPKIAFTKEEKIEQYIADIVFATRYPDRYGLKSLKDMISFGGSPRASINLAKASRAYAFIKRRGYVVPEDIRAIAHDVLRHRIGLTYEAEASNITSEEIVSKIINKVEVP